LCVGQMTEKDESEERERGHGDDTVARTSESKRLPSRERQMIWTVRQKA
jgi:hypothetical protein